MTSRERVRAALRRERVDRVPIFMWFHPVTTQRLALSLEIPAAGVAAAFGNDVSMTWVNNNYAMEGVVHEREGEGHTDDWGIQWVRQGLFNQVVSSPLSGVEPWGWEEYRFPEDRVASLVDLLSGTSAVAEVEGRYLAVDVSPCVFEMLERLRGMEEAILDLVLHPCETEKLLGRCADFAVRLAERAADMYPLDMLWTGDDVASQRAMLMSPAMWRELVKPHLARVLAVGRARGLDTAYHCCGSIPEILEDLVEIGVDVLNPIQYGCPGMEPARLKRDFGDRLCFMGGLDTQDLLPNGSAAEVRRATTALIETLTSDGGGYILAASHTIPPETPLENIFALYDAAGLPRERILDAAAGIRARG